MTTQAERSSRDRPQTKSGWYTAATGARRQAPATCWVAAADETAFHPGRVGLWEGMKWGHSS